MAQAKFHKKALSDAHTHTKTQTHTQLLRKSPGTQKTQKQTNTIDGGINERGRQKAHFLLKSFTQCQNKGEKFIHPFNNVTRSYKDKT